MLPGGVGPGIPAGGAGEEAKGDAEVPAGFRAGRVTRGAFPRDGGFLLAVRGTGERGSAGDGEGEIMKGMEMEMEMEMKGGDKRK